MTDPIRLQLSRKRGFNLQELSIATNGLPGVNVARPTKWGNPYKVGDTIGTREGGEQIEITDNSDAARIFRIMACAGVLSQWEKYPGNREIRAELGGRNLACWCKPGERCHADVLLELANGPICEEVKP